MHYKLDIPQAHSIESQINQAYMAEHSVNNPDDNITTGYLKAHIILGYGYILKDSYTEQFVNEADVIEVVENLPSLYPAYFANLSTEFESLEGETSAVLIANGKVIQNLPAAEIQIVGGTEQQLLDYIFAEEFDLSELPLWNDLIGQFVKKGVWCRFDGKPYISTNPHTVQADWTPDISVSLWVTRWPDGVIGDWRPPTGEHDAYKIGMMVRHIGWIWHCDQGDAAGNNVWEPGVFGWTQIEQIEVPEPPANPCDSIAVWDSTQDWNSYVTGELRKWEIGGVMKVFSCNSKQWAYIEPGQPYSGWKYEYDCPTQ